MTMRKNYDAALVWSQLSEHPLCFYDAHNDATLCAWNGLLLTHNIGLVITGNVWCGIYPNDTQREAIMHEWNRLIAGGVFKSSYERSSYGELISHVKWRIAGGDGSYFQNLKQKHDAQTALGWWDHQTIKRYDEVVRYATEQ